MDLPKPMQSMCKVPGGSAYRPASSAGAGQKPARCTDLGTSSRRHRRELIHCLRRHVPERRAHGTSSPANSTHTKRLALPSLPRVDARRARQRRMPQGLLNSNRCGPACWTNPKLCLIGQLYRQAKALIANTALRRRASPSAPVRPPRRTNPAAGRHNGRARQSRVRRDRASGVPAHPASAAAEAGAVPIFAAPDRR